MGYKISIKNQNEIKTSKLFGDLGMLRFWQC